ncbi:HAD-IA family hydrolase [Candidatus Woesearchaeota archaeon]|nr:HAD-IA family hydrolase [Candidatus Woesearchaeota archaeon]
MIKAIIFDSDDTLIDFSKTAAPCIQKTAAKLKLKVPESDKINKLWGRSLRFIVSYFWGDVYYKKFRREYFKIIFKYKFKEINGAKKVLIRLKRKYKLGVISAKPRPLMIKNFKDTKIDIEMFKFMLSADDTRFHKPDARVFSKVIKNLRVKRNEILYVGDALIDFKAADKAGFNFVAVLTGYYKQKDFVQAGLKRQNIIKSVRELPKWVDRYG